ncbi:MAG: SDR family oxidoreductase [Chitinophagaceae bacterium]|mgnify:CR=1 FL=1|nr:SDR family oxidoreductase [Chitinophagaceae bacterium]
MENKKVAIITGAAGGIGLATARKFAENNFCIALSDINGEGLHKAVEILAKEYQADCLICHGNLEDIHDIENIVEQTLAKWGRIDVLVNNAAWRTIETMRTISLKNWEKTLRINLTAPAFLAKYVAAAMEEKKIAGVILNISSVMSQNAAGYSPAYIACKGGLESLTYELATLYGPSGIRVVGVSPGNIETNLSNDYKDETGNNISEQLIDHMNDHTPLLRAGRPEEIANVCYWLSSGEASFITGASILADGGFLHNFNAYRMKKLQFPKEF